MSEKRRDNKNRILRMGESQRKDGRYVYKYMDSTGKDRFAYSWKLTPTDKTPKGKRDDLSLREKEQRIEEELRSGIDSLGAKMTVFQLCEKHVAQRPNVKKRTESSRHFRLELLRKDPLGARTIESVKPSDAREWALRMKNEGRAYQSVSGYKSALKAAFAMAIRDDLVRKNPFDFPLDTVIPNDTEAKKALTEEEERRLLAFAASDKTYRRYHDAIVVLLGTGLRISELCGLTVSDLDFEGGTITVDHQLLWDSKVGHYIGEPKTKSGFRRIPMSEPVRQALERAIAAREGRPTPIVDGHGGFLFLTKQGGPISGDYYGSVFRGLVKKHNKHHGTPLPHVMPHMLRHTFCTRMATAGMNPKALQYVMGHTSISMTLDYYTHVNEETAKQEFDRLANKTQAV